MTVKAVTLALMAVFYICYFAKMLDQKKKGIDTDQLGKGKEGFARFIETALKTTTYIIPVIQVVSIVIDRQNRLGWVQAAGVAVTAAGVLSFILSVTHMKDNWRAGVQKDAETSLVTDGIYSISRNPAFLGFDLMYIGILISFFNICLATATAAALVLFHLQIVNVEEEFLSQVFGQEYRDYRNSVCRYLGRK